jgi:predicted nucleic acid-binding protein
VTSPDWILDANVLISAALGRQGRPHALVQPALADASIVFYQSGF